MGQTSGQLVSWSALICALVAPPAWAQVDVTADGSIGTIVNYGAGTYTITGGQLQQGNTTLLHSFGDFSLNSNTETIHFDLGNASYGGVANGVTTVIGRVTGGNPSTINGQIRLTGGSTPDLFLINPNGLVFGAGSSLNVPGAFVASTAESVVFANGASFGVDGTTPNPLLTVSTPLGLQMGTSAGAIQVRGNLQVATGQTLGLAGSQIEMTGARLTAPDGRIELWALQNAQITANNQTGWQLASSAATVDWGTVMLQQVSLINANGADGGAIQVRARGLTVQDNSNISSSTSSGQGRGIAVKTTEFIRLLGASGSRAAYNPGIGTSIGLGATGQAGNVTVETGQLYMTNGAWLQSTTQGNNSRTGDLLIRATDATLVGTNPFPNARGIYTASNITTVILSGTNNEGGNIVVETERLQTINGGLISSDLLNFVNPSILATGKTGNILIRASESFEMAGGTNTLRSGVTSSIQPSGSGQGSNIVIETGRLQLTNGGAIRSTLAGNGTGGNINIRATNVLVSDPVVEPLSGLVSGISVSVGTNAVGSGGSINLTADHLQVSRGGQITSSTLGQSPAGNINVFANTLEVQGMSQSLVNGQYLPSAITASSSTAFDAGSVTITGGALSVRDGAQITVTNSGTGNAGDLNITENTIFLDRAGRISASTVSGSGGNISLLASALVLRHGSTVSATAGGAGNGGNITINAPVIAGFDNSDIIANAFQGKGGNIQITTQGIFGLAFRTQLTPENDITASSQFGVNGTVTINTPGIDPGSHLVALPASLSDANQPIAEGCSTSQDNSFTATGRGGLPMNPSDGISSDSTWNDTRDLSAFMDQSAATVPMALTEPTNTAIVEISSWRVNAQGQVELIASPSDWVAATPYATCSS